MDLTCQGGVCAQPVGFGATCDPVHDGCNLMMGLSCNTITHTCDKVQFGGGGARCGTTIQGRLSPCLGEGICRSSGVGATEGVCVAATTDGAACDASTGPACLPPAVCAGGTCRLPAADACP
jgi:hypothetical protein